MKKLRDLPRNDRPRERLLQSGPGSLSDVELLAVLLGSGIKGRDVFAVAQLILKAVDAEGVAIDIQKLVEIAGVGPAKAALVTAALEFARRRIRPEGARINKPSDVLPVVAHYADRKQEHFLCISLNGANEVIACRLVSVGLANSTLVHPREVFADAIADRAVSVILAHNHPGGDLLPSPEDRVVTHRIREAGKVLGIEVLDHVIFSRKGYHSFREAGALGAG
ncbi:MAG: DNA repair protein RadC [Acidobacteria bacterium]|nr:DNA repair protein RadC [Acidobacteriota bacterium]